MIKKNLSASRIIPTSRFSRTRYRERIEFPKRESYYSKLANKKKKGNQNFIGLSLEFFLRKCSPRVELDKLVFKVSFEKPNMEHEGVPRGMHGSHRDKSLARKTFKSSHFENSKPSSVVSPCLPKLYVQLRRCCTLDERNVGFAIGTVPMGDRNKKVKKTGIARDELRTRIGSSLDRRIDQRRIVGC